MIGSGLNGSGPDVGLGWACAGTGWACGLIVHIELVHYPVSRERPYAGRSSVRLFVPDQLLFQRNVFISRLRYDWPRFRAALSVHAEDRWVHACIEAGTGEVTLLGGNEQGRGTGACNL